MAIYRGIPRRIGRGGFKVTKDNIPLNPKRSQKVYNHSPDGFAWGYGGSGPAQLALALLLEETDKETALDNYQGFKWTVVAKWDMKKHWELHSEAIRLWLKANRRRNHA